MSLIENSSASCAPKERLVNIRLVSEGDLRALEWEGEYSHFRRVYANTYRRTLRGLALMWVAEYVPGRLVGQVFLQLSCERPELANGIDRAYFYAFRVRSEMRGRGIGSKMLQTIEDDLRWRDFRYLTLNVAKDNLRARQLYLRMGYLIVAHEPGVWSYEDQFGVRRHVEEPAWRMEKTL